MRISVLILSAVTAFGQQAPAAGGVAQVRAVYLLSMGAGLDQYLANQLASGNVMTVVTDPAKADAVLTDRIGLPFEQRLKELYPPEPPPKPAPAKDAKDAKETDTKTDRVKDEGVVRLGSSTWGRGRGNVFLVDVRSKNILWSTYVPVRNGGPAEMERVAKKVTQTLKKAAGQK